MLHDVKSFEVIDRDPILHSHVSVKYDGTLVVIPLIDYNTLVKRAETAEKELEVVKNKLEAQIEHAKEAVDFVSDLCSYTTTSWYEEHKGAKKGCGRLADAMMIANAVRGMSNDEIQAQSYPYKKGATKVYDRRKVFSALSVKKPGDLERINMLLLDFPEVFADVPREEVYKWMQKKALKGGGKK